MPVLNEDNNMTCLSFILGKEIYAIEVSHVREVLDVIDITRVPRMPESMRGVINLRGSVVPVVDMRAKFGLDRVDDTENTCIIVVEVSVAGEMIVIGALADSVKAVFEIRESDMEPAPSIGTLMDSYFIKGMGKIEEGFVMILNVDHVFSTGDLSTAGTVGHDMAEGGADGQAAVS